MPPRTTIELLLAIARSVDGVATVPEPAALMTGLTAGALDFNLRAWTTDSVSWVVVRSNLAVAVREGLAEAGIEVPRPQSDLHLRGLLGGVRAGAGGQGAVLGLPQHVVEQRQQVAREQVHVQGPFGFAGRDGLGRRRGAGDREAHLAGRVAVGLPDGPAAPLSARPQVARSCWRTRLATSAA